MDEVAFTNFKAMFLRMFTDHLRIDVEGGSECFDIYVYFDGTVIYSQHVNVCERDYS